MKFQDHNLKEQTDARTDKAKPIYFSTFLKLVSNKNGSRGL